MSDIEYDVLRPASDPRVTAVARAICDDDARREAESGTPNPEWWDTLDGSPLQAEYLSNARAALAALGAVR